MYASKLDRRSRCFAHQFQSLPCFDAGEPKLEMILVPSLLMMRRTCACMEAAANVSRMIAARRIEGEIVARYFRVHRSASRTRYLVMAAANASSRSMPSEFAM